jgi:hypothetical protein
MTGSPVHPACSLHTTRETKLDTGHTGLYLFIAETGRPVI